MEWNNYEIHDTLRIIVFDLLVYLFNTKHG